MLSLIRFLVVFAVIAWLGACVSNDTRFDASEKSKRAEAHAELGLLYLRRGNLQFAEEEYLKALKLDRSNATAHHGMGLVDAKRGKLKDAKIALASAAKLAPGNLDMNADYALVLCRLNEEKAGIEVLKKALAYAQPQNPHLGTELALGRCYQSAYNLDLAERTYFRALEISPQLPQALYPMAEIKFQSGEFLSARGFIQRYFDSGPKTAEALLLGIRIEGALDDPEQQHEYFQTLLERYSTSKEADMARELIQ